jgi:hypothetical protein
MKSLKEIKLRMEALKPLLKKNFSVDKAEKTVYVTHA